MNGSAQTAKAGVLMVRSTLSDPADRDAFERWYASDHAPLAAAKLGARTGRRFWSVTESTVHCALYEFDSVARLEAMMGCEVTQWLIDEYDRNWPAPRVTRSREIWADAGMVETQKVAGERSRDA